MMAGPSGKCVYTQFRTRSVYSAYLLSSCRLFWLLVHRAVNNWRARRQRRRTHRQISRRCRQPQRRLSRRQPAPPTRRYPPTRLQRPQQRPKHRFPPPPLPQHHCRRRHLCLTLFCRSVWTSRRTGRSMPQVAKRTWPTGTRAFSCSRQRMAPWWPSLNCRARLLPLR